MFELQFRDPAFLLLSLLTPFVFWLFNRSGAVAQFSSLTILDAGQPSLRAKLASLPALLMSGSFLLLCVALAGPRTPDSETKVSREGIAIMMVVDHSGSMQARDLVRDDRSVDRLSVVKDVFRQFVLGEGRDAGLGRPDDTIGLIAFAGYADSLCPLTLDHGNLTTMAEDLEIVSSRSDDGTAIGDGLALAVERLRQSPAKSRVAIMLTDGVQNAGIIDPLQAAEVAEASNVKVYCIGAGTQGNAPFPTPNPFTGRVELRMMQVELDEETLGKVAETTGGKYFRATDRESLQQIYAEIDDLERTKVTELRYLQYNEHYQSWLLAALGLLVAATITKTSLFRMLP